MTALHLLQAVKFNLHTSSVTATVTLKKKNNNNKGGK